MLHEVVVVLAGFPSSLQTDRLHTGEKDMFLQVVEFGSLHADLKNACHDASGPAATVAATVETELLMPFSSQLVAIEKSILSGGPKYGDPQTGSLAAIFADTVFQWQQAFEYAYGILGLAGSAGGLAGSAGSAADSEAGSITFIDLITKLTADTQSGFARVSALAKKLLVACDRDWLRAVARWSLWGTGTAHVGYFAHPNLDRETNAALYECGRNLEHVDTANLVALHSDVRDTLLAAQALLDDAPLPLASADMHRRAGEIKESVFRMIAQHAVDGQRVRDLLQVIRKTVLGGSDLFCHAFAESAASLAGSEDSDVSDAILQNALASYTEDSDELSVGASALAPRVFHFEMLPDNEQEMSAGCFDDLLFGVRTRFFLDLKWPDTLYFNGPHCNVYADMASYLLSFAVVSSTLPAGTAANPATFTYKLVLNALWQYLQKCIDEAFAVIEPLMSEPPARGLHKQTQALQKLGDQLLLRDEHGRAAMRGVLVEALAAVRTARKTKRSKSTKVPIETEPIQTLIDVAASKNMEPLLTVLEPFFDLSSSCF